MSDRQGFGVEMLNHLNIFEKVHWYLRLAREHSKAVLEGLHAVGGQIPNIQAAMKCALPAHKIWALSGESDLVYEPAVEEEVKALLIYGNVPEVYLYK